MQLEIPSLMYTQCPVCIHCMCVIRSAGTGCVEVENELNNSEQSELSSAFNGPDFQYHRVGRLYK